MSEGHETRRVLITGISTPWAGRLAAELEADPQIDVIIGVDRNPPKTELTRTEFVKVSDSHSLIRRIVQAAQIDTVVDTRLVVDSIVTSARLAHENNVIGTLNVLAACSGADSSVRKFVFKSSGHYYGSEQDDPGFFTEDMRRPHPPRTSIERDLLEAEASVAEFATQHRDATVTILRMANGLGPSLNTSHMSLLSLPFVPAILGFEPRYQFIHRDDMVGALHHVVVNDLPGVFNVAGDGVLVLSEIARLLGKPLVGILPPWGTGPTAAALRQVGIQIPPEMLQLLRFGRAMDNRRLRASGYRYRFTTRETVLKLREHQRVSALMRGRETPYRYERDVEEFLRWSPSVRVAGGGDGTSLRPTVGQLAELKRAIVALEAGEGAGGLGDAPRALSQGPGYDSLGADEVVALLPTLDPGDLEALRDYEERHAARPAVLSAIDGLRGLRA
jgi:UDP-glucose 4-epimerase